jgi:zinc protease
VACDVARQPTFPDHEVATRRAELVTVIQEAIDDPASVAVDALQERLYPAPHPLGRPVRGRRETVERLERGHLAAFHGRHFVPATTTAVAVGDLEAEALAEHIAQHLHDWDGAAHPRISTPASAPPGERTLVVRPMPDKSQCDVAYGFIGLARSDPDYYAALVMNNALGQYALGGRLGDSIRERQGMAYYVYSQMDAGRDAGPLMVRAGVSRDNVERTIASIDQEIDAVLTTGFTAAEVRDAKRYLIGSLPRQLETNAGIASFLLSAELFGLGVDHDVRLPALVGAVTDDDVARVARRLLDPSRALVVVAGPWNGSAA